MDAAANAMAKSCDQHTITGDDRLHDDCSILPAIAALDLTAVNAYLCSESYALTPWKQADILVLERLLAVSTNIGMPISFIPKGMLKTAKPSPDVICIITLITH